MSKKKYSAAPTRLLLAASLAGFLVSVSAAVSGAVLDPDKAAVAAVDRFSKDAAHLQLRAAGNGIPGPNQPVDFDAGPFNTQGLSPQGKPVRYYNFDVQPTTPATVYVVYRAGASSPLAGQLPIIDELPGEKGYNDFRQVTKVTVPASYEANSIVDAAALKASGFKLEKTDAIRNMPVVPDGSVARHRLNGADASLQRAWYHGKVAKYFAFDETALLAANGEDVPISPISVFFNINPDQPNGGPASGFRKEPGSPQTHNVVSTVPGNPSYSPLWVVSVFDTADWPKVHDLDSATNARILAASVATVNCPIFFVTQ
jgi:hypothetical protein